MGLKFLTNLIEILMFRKLLCLKANQEMTENIVLEQQMTGNWIETHLRATKLRVLVSIELNKNCLMKSEF